MNILFLMLAFPNLEKSSNLYTDLVEEFAAQGHHVFPVAPAQTDERTGIYEENRIQVLRVKTMPLFNVNFIRKGIANIWLPYQYKTAIKCHFKKIHFDLVIMPTPPITMIKIADYIKRRDGAKFYLILRDIFPQNAVDLGLMKKGGIVYHLFRRKEKKMYRQADQIGCMSQGNVDYVKKFNPEVDPGKLHILMNFQKPSALAVIDEGIKEKYGLTNKFIVVFGGNMGIPQQLENVIALAKACQEDYPDVIFFLIGKGTQKKEIMDMAAKENVENILFRDLVPQKDYLQLVSQCDIGLISLNINFTIPNIPSKTMAYYDAGIPVLASIDASTDYGRILEESKSGLYSLSGDLQGLKKNFDLLYHDARLREEMGENGRQFMKEHMTPEVAYKVIMSKIIR